MAKWHGRVGYGNSVDRQHGVWEDEVTERKYYGDVIRNTRRLVTGNEVNSDITTSNSISIVADPYALKHFFAIKYVEWEGALWNVNEVEAQSPRLLLRLGGVYNGPTPSAPSDSDTGAG